MTHIPPFDDLSEPYDENGYWHIDEQLYPESRGKLTHTFSAEGTAFMFYEMSKRIKIAREPLKKEKLLSIIDKYLDMRQLDRFAGEALNGWISTYGEESFPNEEGQKTIARNIYKMAFAMMEERKKYER